ncbi:MAG TPA: hypothetical protein VJ783_18495, partial [Pirellulales bacterium]|nr:hypothetical protein [Pirellulales bacterium]
ENVQNNDGGWRYSVGAFEPSDCSVSGWVMLALKTARVAKLEVQPQTISRMMSFFASQYADGLTYYQRPVTEPVTDPRGGPGGTITILKGPWLVTDATTGVGMMAVEFFQHKLDSPIVQGGAAYLADKADALAPPTPGAGGVELRFRGFNAHRKAIFDSQQIPASTDYYLWYNCTMAMFQAGGDPWKRWNGAMRDRLIALQVPGEGCDRGSWIPQGDAYGDWGGRIYTTALALLTLEVYYRFQRVADEPTEPLADAPGKPPDVPEQPELGVVADTPEGLYAARTKPKTAEWLAARGGTAESQKAVEDGLDWLARHQGEEGHWGADCLGSTDPNSRCDRSAPCEGPGLPYEIAHTGLALLAFQAAGHYYFNGQKYSGQVARGLDYFVEEQAPDGSIVGSQNPSPELMRAGAPFQRNFMYEHAIGTLALCEACAVALAEGQKPDPRYQRAAQRAVSFIEKEQHRDGGWRYGGDRHALDEKSDCSVSGWVMLALKTAGEAKVHVSPQTISQMTDFFAAHYVHGRTIYQLPSTPGGDAIIGMGMMAVEFFEHKLESPVVQNGAAYLASEADVIRDRPAISAYYSWCNGTMAMFQAGGEPWNRWNGVIRDHVVSIQVHSQSCDRGSWPPDDQWGLQGGRIYATALAVLTLEVYYRYQRIAGQPEKEKEYRR